jgi:imidazolonepropionase-like amidohydrolase
MSRPVVFRDVRVFDGDRIASPASVVVRDGLIAGGTADWVAEGSDHIKIIVEDPRFPGTKPLDAATIEAIASAARQAGLRSVAHVVSADTLRTAVGAGVDVVTHAALTIGLGDDDVALLATRPVTIIPTLGMMDGVARAIGGRLPVKVLSAFVPAIRMHYRHAEATVGVFRRAGRTVLAGTDANDEPQAPHRVAYGESLHDELERLVAAGLAPAEALRAATSQAAQVFGLDDRGVIAAGRRADLVLIDGDPVRDITSTRLIRGVWIGGARVR